MLGRTKKFLIISMFSVIIYDVQGRGRMSEPPQRSSLWRHEEWRGKPMVATNTEDNGLNCGGYWKLHEINMHRCGICGDPYDDRNRPNEAGGRYGLGIIARTYHQDNRFINVSIDITADIGGYFEFRLCPNNDITRRVTQSCLDKYLLVISGHGTRYYPNTDGVINLRLKMPDEVTCEQCVLQWKWKGSYYWGQCEDGYGGIGCGNQEEYYNCADIAILPSKSQSLPQSTTPKGTTVDYWSVDVTSDVRPSGLPVSTTTVDNSVTTPDWLWKLLSIIKSRQYVPSTTPNIVTDQPSTISPEVISGTTKLPVAITEQLPDINFRTTAPDIKVFEKLKPTKQAIDSTPTRTSTDFSKEMTSRNIANFTYSPVLNVPLSNWLTTAVPPPSVQNISTLQMTTEKPKTDESSYSNVNLSPTTSTTEFPTNIDDLKNTTKIRLENSVVLGKSSGSVNINLSVMKGSNGTEQEPTSIRTSPLSDAQVITTFDPLTGLSKYPTEEIAKETNGSESINPPIVPGDVGNIWSKSDSLKNEIFNETENATYLSFIDEKYLNESSIFTNVSTNQLFVESGIELGKATTNPLNVDIPVTDRTQTTESIMSESKSPVVNGTLEPGNETTVVPGIPVQPTEILGFPETLSINDPLGLSALLNAEMELVDNPYNQASIMALANSIYRMFDTNTVGQGDNPPQDGVGNVSLLDLFGKNQFEKPVQSDNVSFASNAELIDKPQTGVSEKSKASVMKTTDKSSRRETSDNSGNKALTFDNSKQPASELMAGTNQGSAGITGVPFTSPDTSTLYPKTLEEILQPLLSMLIDSSLMGNTSPRTTTVPSFASGGTLLEPENNNESSTMSSDNLISLSTVMPRSLKEGAEIITESTTVSNKSIFSNTGMTQPTNEVIEEIGLPKTVRQPQQGNIVLTNSPNVVTGLDFVDMKLKGGAPSTFSNDQQSPFPVDKTIAVPVEQNPQLPVQQQSELVGTVKLPLDRKIAPVEQPTDPTKIEFETVLPETSTENYGNTNNIITSKTSSTNVDKPFVKTKLSANSNMAETLQQPGTRVSVAKEQVSDVIGTDRVRLSISPRQIIETAGIDQSKRNNKSRISSQSPNSNYNGQSAGTVLDLPPSVPKTLHNKGMSVIDTVFKSLYNTDRKTMAAAANEVKVEQKYPPERTLPAVMEVQSGASQRDHAVQWLH